ncbi:MAG: class II fructose-bisphosphate aldolase [Lachnospiraceae bacterium]|nr:class II fructose-bisphosphate aldolase [Lachnospiraceae bacterium]MCD8249357.1 class II fructose-bisphosphate aldolase [Lachnospiraceae bacterium]
MPLVTLKEVLSFAEEKKTAIPAFNIDNMEITQSIMKVCEEENYPVILAIGQAAIRDGKMPLLAACARVLAKRSPIPVVIHLDHGQNLDQVRQALDCGFTSVMIDGSRLPFEENVAVSREALKLARTKGATVEAELGCILGVEDDISHDADKPFLVRTEDVKAFNEAVRVDALAVGIGNAHGIYKGLPNLDFERLSEVNDISDVPLVLHGGSGIPADMIQKAISLGIRKINVATEIRLSYIKGLQETVKSGDFYTMSDAGKAAVAELARAKIRLFKNGNA